MTITIHLTPDLERELRETSAAKGVPAEEFVVGALSESLKHAKTTSRLPPRLSAEESRLLIAINEGLPELVWRRFHELNASRRAETLTADEQVELIQLNDRIEHLNVQRLEKLIELAKLRNVDVKVLMDQLGLQDPGYD
jgi:hypothetical protein